MFSLFPIRTEYFFAAIISMFIMACDDGRVDKHSDTPPPIVFSSSSVGGGHLSIVQVTGIRDYIARYGKNGWVAGLTDLRTMRSLVQPVNSDAPDIDDPNDPAMRVADIFVVYYHRWLDKSFAYASVEDYSLHRDERVSQTLAAIMRLNDQASRKIAENGVEP